MKIITITSSLKFKNQIIRAIEEFNKIGIKALFPNLEDSNSSKKITADFIKKVAIEHYQAIEQGEALYVICPNGYIGNSGGIEIGYACAKSKPVIYSEVPDDLGFQVLADAIISINEIASLRSQ